MPFDWLQFPIIAGWGELQAKQ
ncbi:protein of unknown function [Burkholderia multivorans]